MMPAVLTRRISRHHRKSADLEMDGRVDLQNLLCL